MEKKKPLHQFEISKLKNATQDEVIKDKTLSEGFKPMKNVTEHINTREVVPQKKLADVYDKVAEFRAKRALEKAGKKAVGIVPFAGAAYGLMSGDPAMAAEELAQDAMGPAGMAYEALRPADTGNVEEERMMIAERNAREAYDRSPARQARLEALRRLSNK